ncbi:MAG: hypothetical protein KJO07_19405, partial [Deltaproteobacteria bacterium]|nr:hypothetical protein [Deltaproteobacteria bacterium]
VRAALSSYSQQPQRTETGPSRHRRRWQLFADQFCPLSELPGDDAFASVCSQSPLDGVLECRVAVQPELSVRLGHLLELVSLVPGQFVGDKRARPAISSSLAVLRGDTGEILAQAHFVAGREATAYAPATPSLEKYLIDVREDRDPRTGKRLPAEESGAEKVGWNRPIAIGSVLKPLVARAAERVDRDWLANLRMSTELRMKTCKNGVHPVLGYCPRTASVWNSPMAAADSTDFLGKSLNWFQAGLGILATGLGGEISVDTSELVQVGGKTTSDEVWTAVGGREVLGSQGIDLEALSRAPMWRELEALVGRSRCDLASKKECARKQTRRDICAARALPIEVPSRDLRHLVALGPGSFDFLPEGRYRGGRVPVVEYLEFLRGSGAHPLGSLLQVADAYARVFFAPIAGRPKLAASWFPAEPTGTLPASCSSSPASPTLRGMCRALAAGGTATVLGTRLRELGVVAFGAKTGTIDSLGDIAESPAACKRFNLNHTVPGQKEQPYHLECGKRSSSISDSLLVVGFGVKTEGKLVPVVLALRFQAVGGSGFAAKVADLFAAEIVRYLRPARGTPAGVR